MKIAQFGKLDVHSEFSISGVLYIKISSTQGLNAQGKVRAFAANAVVEIRDTENAGGDVAGAVAAYAEAVEARARFAA